MEILIKRKGVNLQEFIAKRSTNKLKQENHTKLPENKSTPKQAVPIAVSNKQVRIKKEKKNEGKKHSDNSEKLEVNLFKFIHADRIVGKDKLLAFVKWFGIPREIRRLKTQSEFATAFGVNIDTLTSWKKLSGFYEEVQMYHFNEMKRFMTNVGYGIVKSAIAGNPKSAELYFKIYMNWNEKVKVEDTIPERIVTDEQKAEIERALKNIGLATIIKNNKKTDDDS